MKDFSKYPDLSESIEFKKKCGLEIIGVKESEVLIRVYMVKPSIPGLYTKIWYQKGSGRIFYDTIDVEDIASLLKFDKSLQEIKSELNNFR